MAPKMGFPMVEQIRFIFVSGILFNDVICFFVTGNPLARIWYLTVLCQKGFGIILASQLHLNPHSKLTNVVIHGRSSCVGTLLWEEDIVHGDGEGFTPFLGRLVLSRETASFR